MKYFNIDLSDEEQTEMKKLTEEPTGSRRAQRSEKETQRQREKRWSQQCHAGRKALPWHPANQREVVEEVLLVVIWAGGGGRGVIYSAGFLLT